ncbi:MAG TPA: LLM class flavin-dependent oxidoreductase [Deltaproteobacteria bacterium]|nr:LLM class flavin-dependent oxidoreductase [Deltaproteobacteria bacterium]
MPANRPFSCVLIGSESLLIQCGEVLREKGQEIRAVVSDDDQILDWAGKSAIPTLAPGKGLADRLRPIDHDYLFSITNLTLLPEEVLRLPKRAAINFHDGPLPRYAGMYAPVWALLEGETEYGVSFHEMTAGADEGDLYVQRLFEIGPEETSLTLNTHCYAAAIEAFTELVDGLVSGRLEKRPQDLSQRTYFGRFQRPAAAAVLDWQRPAEELIRWIRAMDFGSYENAFALPRMLHRDGQGGPGDHALHLVRKAEVQTGADPTDRPSGTILGIDGEGMTIACGDGQTLRLTEMTCPKGVPIEPARVASRLGLAEGGRLEPLSPEVIERLESLGTEATRAEAFWVRRLAGLESIEMPYRNAEAGARPPSESGCVELARPTGFAGDAIDWIAGFATYLARISGRSTFDVSYSDAGLAERVEGLTEVFAERVPLRIRIDLGGTAAEAREAVAESLERTQDRQTFFQDVVARYPQLARNPDLVAGRLATVAVEIRDDVEAALRPEGTDCVLVVDPAGDRVRLLHDPQILDPSSVREIADQLGVFLEGFARGNDPIRKLALQDETHRAKILVEWNRTAVDYPRDRCIHDFFEDQVATRPDETALVFEDETLDYRSLAQRVHRLAHHLVGLGVGPDTLVGIHLERSIDMVVAVLATLEAGGAYVPLDPTYPADRIAYMIEDSKAGVVLTTSDLAEAMPAGRARVVRLDREAEAIAAHPDTRPESRVDPSHLAYVIYTSGSTGKPKGVMVEHRNVVNFFAGMDERIPHDPPGAWLALTSLSFDISVLELLWTLTRGFKLVVYLDRERKAVTPGSEPFRPLDFGLAMWGSDAGPGPRKYELMLEAARFGDTHGFSSICTPERHFGAFGGPFPNPSVTSAAIAAVTDRIQIRSGSCILPLHHPIRVAEEWAVVDNLSGGRVGLAFASGWQPNDFVIRKDNYADAKKTMFESAKIVQRLWRGEAVEFESPTGALVPTATLPRPVQKDLPSWMTTAGNPETFRAAGEGGFNILTHLLGQSLEELAEKIKVYRRARAAAGYDPETGVVTCMLHTFVGDDLDEVRETVRQPMKDYLASAMALVVGFAWTFPAFERPGGPDSKPEDVDLASLTEDETDAILEFAFERYFETSGLFGTPEVCAQMVDRVKAADIDEIACLIDFGVPVDTALSALPLLDQVRREANEAPAGFDASAPVRTRTDHSMAAQIERHGITHMQCTPSHASMLLTDPDTREAVSRIEHWMIGGEAFPVSLAADLADAGCRNITNMYGPTETTIWSSTEVVEGRPESISIGRPIANTRFYILGEGDEPLPVGIPGELLIGGDGVVRGYLDRPELTAERFVPDPFSEDPGARLYRTGDLARWRSDGTIEFLGRLDHQVKIRGYRIELGEIEARLAALPEVREAVVIAREDVPGDVRLVAYLIAEATPLPEADLKAALLEDLPDFMVPSAFVHLDRYPQTPNGKIDRKALPVPDQVQVRSKAEFKAPDNELEMTIAEVWKQVLYLDQVGIDDNFFDLGGHSLLVVQAHRKLREACPKPISLTDLYRFPTIRGLAAHLGEDGGSVEQVEKSQARGEKRRQALGRRRRRGQQR